MYTIVPKTRERHAGFKMSAGNHGESMYENMPEGVGRGGYYACDVDVDFSGCIEDCHDICRCQRITSARVVDVSVSALVGAVYPEPRKLPAGTRPRQRQWYRLDYIVRAYAVERMLVALGVRDTNNWSVETCNGYYGEEIASASFSGPRGDIDHNLRPLNGLTADQMIEASLRFEYGYLFDGLENGHYVPRIFDLEVVVAGQRDHLARVDGANYPIREDAILGLVDSNQMLVDGYHRFRRAQAEGRTHGWFIQTDQVKQGGEVRVAPVRNDAREDGLNLIREVLADMDGRTAAARKLRRALAALD